MTRSYKYFQGKYTETGAGKSKKLAKRQAANKMIQRLKDLPMENEDAFQNIDDDELAQGGGQRDLLVRATLIF